MDFALSQEQQLLQRAAADFATILRSDCRRFEQHGVTEALRQQYAALGFSRADWPEALGGSGLGNLERALLLEELAYGCAGATVALELDDWARMLLLGAGLPEKLATLAPPLSLAVDVDVRLQLSGQQVYGSLPLVLGRPRTLLVLQPGRLLLVEQGLQLTPVLPLALHAAGVCRTQVQTNTAQVFVLSAAAEQQLWDKLRLWLAALLLGVTRAAHEYAIAYTKERQAFGRPIAYHQAMAFELANHCINIEAMRTMLHMAAAINDSQTLTQAYIEIAEQCPSQIVASLQQLGGHGFVKDHLVEKWFREARALALLFGGADAARVQLETSAPEHLADLALV